MSSLETCPYSIFIIDGPRALKIWTVFYNLEKVVAPPHLKGRAAERFEHYVKLEDVWLEINDVHMGIAIAHS